jgi:hypothetical protein
MTGAVKAKTRADAFLSGRFLIAAVPTCIFIGLVIWFDGVDFYVRHFFDRGPIVAVDNFERILLTATLAWLIYVPGAAVAALIMPARTRVALTPAERGVLGFGIGVGIWHVAMLILGVLGLYYRSVAGVLCLLILIASGYHFADVAGAGWRRFADFCRPLRRRLATAQEIGAIAVVVVAALVLLRRGLFPGGGGDYYTHYFYYYLAVIENHGLAPNDVWYHYYYSKGSGLAFLGMLLSDPEAPALATYICVAFAAAAIVTLLRRIAPNSLWPAVGALVYLLFYLMGVEIGTAEGEFQKDHEEVAALVTLAVWALTMECWLPALPFRVMTAASAIAAAIVTQVVGIVLGLFIGLLWLWSVARRQWRDVWGYTCVGGAITAAVIGMFVLGYMATGLATDQPLDLMLRFADPARLDRWGVIPQIIAVAWIRDNYDALVQPLGWDGFKELAITMRLGVLWPFLFAPVIAALVRKATDSLAGGRLVLFPDRAEISLAGAIAVRLAALLVLLAVIALSMGRGQSVSFGRLSTFLVPLWTLFGTAGSVWALSWPSGRRLEPWGWIVLPVVLLAVVMHGWQKAESWTKRLPTEMANTAKFVTGKYSLDEAYGHASSPFNFGGINPGALAAAKTLPFGTPIWSTNVFSYCMAPGCLIESVASFKMSDQLDEILGGDPELAKRRLQEAGLNYFIFMNNFRLLDLLPYSPLFAPDTIGRYLGIKWTDPSRSTYLLTWIGSDTRPIGPEFLEDYRLALNAPEFSWFVFTELAPRIAAITPAMRKAQWGAMEQYFVWRHPPPGTIDVVQADYGRGCRDFKPKRPFRNNYRDGNETAGVRRACTGKSHCLFAVDEAMLGDPVPGCQKDFVAEYRCEPQGPATKTVRVAAEADGATVVLDCAGVETPNAKVH